MARSWIAEHYPRHEAALRKLVEQHREITYEPLHLALIYRPPHRDPRHIYLFEVLTMISNGLNWEDDLFEVELTAGEDFPLTSDEALHLIITNPIELEHAARHGWPIAAEVSAALSSGDFEILLCDKTGEDALRLLGQPAPAVVAHG